MRRDRLLVAEMIGACARIVELVADRDEAAVEADPTSREALLWNFTVLGEAAGQVSASLRAVETEVPWRRATAMRNRIVHGYWSVETDIVVTTARDEIPGLAERLRDLGRRLTD
jgi:uncharacterized protein with HEPN domain